MTVILVAGIIYTYIKKNSLHFIKFLLFFQACKVILSNLRNTIDDDINFHGIEGL
jgi:hypothetical protein